MLHLAQVQKQEISGKLGLRLLACEEAEYSWARITEEVVIPNIETMLGARLAPNTLSEGLLVLVKLSPTREVEGLQNATSWVLELVETYLTSGITPAFLQQETERAEKWRQTLTLQTQELARRSLEVEARREQIQALEEGLKRDKGDNPEESLKP
jgi:hypothetical protein